MTQGLELRGAVLGRGYRLGRKLDTDDAATYEATHERIPGRFIIRLFSLETLSHPEASSRIQRGARVASLLRDPHAVQVLDCNVSGDTPAFVVSERVTGQSLTEVMTHDGMLPLPRVVELVESIAAALAAGHKIGLVHGDIRPAHVVLATSGQPPAKLSGFGWAKELRAAATTPAPSGYLAPEQNQGKILTLDERVDQFGLATLAYEMIAGCLPFENEGADLADGARTHLRIPPALADLVQGVPRALDDVLRRGLAFAASDRFSDVTELAEQVRAAALSSSSPMRANGRASEAAGKEAPGPAGAVRTEDALSGSDDDVGADPDFVALSSIRLAAQNVAGEGRREEREGFDISEDEDALLVLGGNVTVTATVTASGTGTTTDDAKTQIVRSPFFEEPGVGEDSTFRPMPAALTPRRGLPVGRPSVGTASSGHRSGGVPIGSGSRATNPGLDPQGSAATGRTLSYWFNELKQSKWAVPALTGVGLLVIVGTIIRVSTGANHERAVDGVERSATPPTKPGPAASSTLTATPPAPAPTPPSPPPVVEASPAPSGNPEALPASAASPSATTPAAPPGAISAPPAPPSATNPTPEPPNRPEVASTPNAAGAALGPSTALQQTSTADSQAAVVASQQHANRPVRRPPPKVPASATTPVPPAVKGAPAPGGASDCTIRISSKPWAEIWIDGKNTGRKTPVDNMKIACGTRKLELKRPDQDMEQMEMLKVVPGKPFRGNYELE